MMYYLGKRSIANQDGVSPYLQMVNIRAISICSSDYGVLESGGERTAREQHQIFTDGHSKCDGYEKLSYHQSGNALDTVPYIDGKYTWSNRQAFIDILDAWKQAEIELRKLNMIPDDIYIHHGIYWNWQDLDNDGILEITDKLGWDAAHHELRSKPQVI